jgi:hypothetical protein
LRQIITLNGRLPDLIPCLPELLMSQFDIPDFPSDDLDVDDIYYEVDHGGLNVDENWGPWQTLVSSDKKWIHIMTFRGRIVQIDLQKFHAQEESCLTILSENLPVKIHVIRLSPDGRFLFTLDDHGRILQIDLVDPSKCYT